MSGYGFDKSMSASDYYKMTGDWRSLSPTDFQLLVESGVIAEHLDSDDVDVRGDAAPDYSGQHKADMHSSSLIGD